MSSQTDDGETVEISKERLDELETIARIAGREWAKVVAAFDTKTIDDVRDEYTPYELLEQVKEIESEQYDD